LSLMGAIKEKMKEMLAEDYLEERQDKYSRFYIRINSKKIRDTTQLLVNDFDGRLVALSATDEGVQGFDLVYHFDFSHKETRLHLAVKTRVPRKKPEVDSVVDIAWSMNWAERELMDLMGIKFIGHPDPRRLFLPYAWPSEEVG